MVSNGVSVSQSKVIRQILALEIPPRLRLVDLCPHVVQAAVESLLRRYPIVGTSAETLAHVPGLFATEVVEPVGKHPVGLVGQSRNISGTRFVRRQVVFTGSLE